MTKLSQRNLGYRRSYGHAFDGTELGPTGGGIDDVPEGNVICQDNRGRDDATTWGNILTETAHQRKMAGTVIDGINRDVALCSELNYPIYN